MVAKEIVKKKVAKKKVINEPEVPEGTTTGRPDQEEPVEEVEEPKFKNNGKDIKINLGTKDESNWLTVKEGEVVTIPRDIALANKLEEVK